MRAVTKMSLAAERAVTKTMRCGSSYNAVKDTLAKSHAVILDSHSTVRHLAQICSDAFHNVEQMTNAIEEQTKLLRKIRGEEIDHLLIEEKASFVTSISNDEGFLQALIDVSKDTDKVARLGRLTIIVAKIINAYDEANAKLLKLNDRLGLVEGDAPEVKAAKGRQARMEFVAHQLKVRIATVRDAFNNYRFDVLKSIDKATAMFNELVSPIIK